MQPIDVPDRSHGLIPLPRLINQQLDAQLEFRVATIEKELLAELQKQILEHNSTDWFGIFLTIYVHLSSLERDTWSLNTWEHDGPTLQEQVRQLVGFTCSYTFHGLLQTITNICFWYRTSRIPSPTQVNPSCGHSECRRQR